MRNASKKLEKNSDRTIPFRYIFSHEIMKHIRAIPALVVALLAGLLSQFSAVQAEPNALTEDEKEVGFQLLFDGKTLEGWEHEGNWTVENGTISRKDKGGSLVWKVKPIPDNFELRFQWKVAERSNSGVYYRPGQYEYQILDNGKHIDGLNPRTSAASLYFCMAPSKDATRPVGEWNDARIVCQGTVIQHWLNDEKVIDFNYLNPRWKEDIDRLAERGGKIQDRGAFLSLQDHGDPVWYRSFRLRELKPDEDIGHETVEPAEIPEAALKKEALILERIQKNREAREKAVKGN